jgi:hypothetical protein
MPSIEFIRGEIERMRNQVNRQRREIMQLRHAGISTTSAEALLDGMRNKVNDLCTERDRLWKEQFRLSGAHPSVLSPISLLISKICRRIGIGPYALCVPFSDPACW